jgi:hypothetical protein
LRISGNKLGLRGGDARGVKERIWVTYIHAQGMGSRHISGKLSCITSCVPITNVSLFPFNFHNIHLNSLQKNMKLISFFGKETSRVETCSYTQRYRKPNIALQLSDELLCILVVSDFSLGPKTDCNRRGFSYHSVDQVGKFRRKIRHYSRLPHHSKLKIYNFSFITYSTIFLFGNHSRKPVTVAVRSEAWVLACWLRGSWVRIPLKAWMFVPCLSVLCCPV